MHSRRVHGPLGLSYIMLGRDLLHTPSHLAATLQRVSNISIEYEQLKTAKEIEFREQSLYYEKLERDLRGQVCICDDARESSWNGGDFYRPLHDPDCRRCDTCDRQQKLRIEVLEDPLPRTLDAQMNLVFELDPPDSICAYRDMLLHFRQEVLGYQYKQRRPMKLRKQ